MAALLLLFGFVIPIVLGFTVVVLLRRFFGARQPAWLWDVVAIAVAAILVMVFFLVTAMAGGITAPRDAATFIGYAVRMTLLTLPIWGALGFVLPHIAGRTGYRSKR